MIEAKILTKKNNKKFIISINLVEFFLTTFNFKSTITTLIQEIDLKLMFFD